jgi:hypothetical protein
VKNFNASFSGADARNVYALTPSDTVYNYHGNSTATQFTVPSGANILVFSSTGPFWALYGGINPVAVIPSANVTNGTASICNPSVWTVTAGTLLSVIAVAGVDVCLLWYI